MGTRGKIKDLNDGWAEGGCNDERQTQNQKKAENERHHMSEKGLGSVPEHWNVQEDKRPLVDVVVMWL